MSIKADVPINSKFDSAQQDLSIADPPIADPPVADDEDGNLSEKKVEERFKALSEDTKKLFKKLETELDQRYIGSVSDILEWGAYLRRILKTSDHVDLFTKWRFFGRSESEENHPNAIKNTDYGVFRDDLTAANWNHKNEAYDRVFQLMWNTSSDDPAIFLLKQLNQKYLAVAVNPRCLSPRDPLRNSLDAYNIIGSNLDNILGMRYYTDHVMKEMIIAPFGQILFCADPELMRFPWDESEYALVLEIRDDGKAGDFYFVYNGADIDTPASAHEDLKGGHLAAEAEDGTVNFKPVLCGQGPFTVGKVKPSMGLGLFGCHDFDYIKWLCLFLSQTKVGLRPHNFEAEENIQLEYLSNSKPEIVMTGIRKSRKGKKIVGLYDKE